VINSKEKWEYIKRREDISPVVVAKLPGWKTKRIENWEEAEETKGRKGGGPQLHVSYRPLATVTGRRANLGGGTGDRKARRVQKRKCRVLKA